MAAIIRIGNTQVKVNEGDRIKVEKLPSEKGETIEINEVLAIISGNEVVFGKPLVADAKVEAKVVSHGRGDKMKIFKYKPKKRYRKVTGHRQHYTEIEIGRIITAGAGETAQ